MQRAGHETSALMEFCVGEGGTATASASASAASSSDEKATAPAFSDKFTIELSKTELQSLLEKLDRVQSQLDSLSSR